MAKKFKKKGKKGKGSVPALAKKASKGKTKTKGKYPAFGFPFAKKAKKGAAKAVQPKRRGKR